MKTSIKALQDISSLHDLRTYTGAIRKSSKPALPTTAILDLYMRRNERDRLIGELKKLKRRRQQLQKRLEDVEKEMVELLERTAEMATALRGTPLEGKTAGLSSGVKKKKGKMVLEY